MSSPSQSKKSHQKLVFPKEILSFSGNFSVQKIKKKKTSQAGKGDFFPGNYLWEKGIKLKKTKKPWRWKFQPFQCFWDQKNLGWGGILPFKAARDTIPTFSSGV